MVTDPTCAPCNQGNHNHSINTVSTDQSKIDGWTCTDRHAYRQTHNATYQISLPAYSVKNLDSLQSQWVEHSTPGNAHTKHTHTHTHTHTKHTHKTHTQNTHTKHTHKQRHMTIITTSRHTAVLANSRAFFIEWMLFAQLSSVKCNQKCNQKSNPECIFGALNLHALDTLEMVRMHLDIHTMM